jgi:hypothetical protein
MQLDFKGLDIIRGRDCTLFIKGDAQTVAVSPALLSGGWVGGQGVTWTTSLPDTPTVTYSNGLYGGFMIWGSDEASDQYTAMTGQQLKYGYGVMMVGRALLSTIAYEQYTYASRLVGPLVPIMYQPSQILYLSLRGYWTNEDELTLSGNPLAPAFFTGFVAQKPKVNNQMRLGIQTSM